MENFIEFPVFDGVSGDLKQWILWLEAFFVREKFTALEKMNLAQSLLEGKAEVWFYRNQEMLPFQSWEYLKYNLWLRFGDFADYDRLLQEQRVEKRRKRMSRAAITPHGSISSPATIHEPVPVDKFFTQQVDEISGEKKDESHEATLVKVSDSLEEESIHQNQVPVSQLEPSLQIPKESPNVCENAQAVVGCEHQRSFQKKIRMDVVNGDVERSQRVMSITKNVSAHQVFDTMCQLKRLKPKNKRKLSLSPKSRMFKFKNKTLLSNWSQMDLHQVIDISNVTNSYPCLSADFGLVRKKRTFQCLRLRNLRLHKQAHMSRFLNPLRMLHDPGGMKQLLHGDMKPCFVCERESGKRFRDMAVQPTRQVGLDTIAQLDQRDITLVGLKVAIASLLEVICAWAECMMHTTIVISAKLYSPLSCAVATNENMSSGLSQTRQVWKPGGVLAAHLLGDWLVDFHDSAGIVDGIKSLAIGVCSGIQQPIDSRRASRVWERGGLDISTFVSFNLQSYSSWCGWMVFDRGKNNKWDAHVDSLISSMLPSYAQDIMKRQADKKRRNVEFSVGDWVYIKLQPYRQLSVMHRIHQKLAAKFFDPFLVIELIGMVASTLEDCISLYPISKLEDKLVFEGASIDTIHHLYYSKKKQVVTWQRSQVEGKTPIVREALLLALGKSDK